MENKEMIESACQLGAHKASVIDTKLITLDKVFRTMCASNACGMYGKCYMCPPDIGSIEELMSCVGQYDYALVYQTVGQLEDSFDFEGMMAAKKNIDCLAQKLRKVFLDLNISRTLHLGTGACGLCRTCAKITNEPCRFPKEAMSSLEAYGINVSELAKVSKMQYINGPKTVTYFGTVLFSLDGEA